MTDLPEPLVLPSVDLRDFVYMPLDALRLRDSEMAIEASPEVFRASVLLWCAAWHQVPAGSLPDKDKTLAEYSRAGARWPRIRAEVLLKWVRCSDGRLYHPVVAEKAREAQAAKSAQRARTRAATEARELKRRVKPSTPDVSPQKERDEQRDVDPDEQRDVDRNVVQGKGREEEIRERAEKGAVSVFTQGVAREPDPAEVSTLPGRMCRAMKAAGLQGVNPGHPDLLALIAAGVTEPEFAGAAQSAIDRGKGFVYALAVAKGQRADAAANLAIVRRGTIPRGPPRGSAVDRQIATMNALTGQDRDRSHDPKPDPSDIVDIDARVVR